MTPRIIKAEPFLKVINSIANGQFAYLDNDAFELLQEPTLPLEGYEEPEGYPNCCEHHRSLLEIGNDAFSRFPNCCVWHKKLLKESWFDKNNYSYLPKKLVDTISYTFHCIEKCIKEDNWLKKICDYIEYTNASFGAFPLGFGSPLGLELYLANVRHRLQQFDEIDDFKRIAINSFITSIIEPTKERKDEAKADLNDLLMIYRQWLKEFPFQISYLSHLRPFYESKLPIISGVGETNSYSGHTLLTLHTKQSLVEWLCAITGKMLSDVNSVKLYQSGKLDHPEKIKLELHIAKRLQVVEAGYVNTSPDPSRSYRRILKSWLQDEKKFIVGLIKCLKDIEDTSKVNLSSNELHIKTHPSFLPETLKDFIYIIKPFFAVNQHEALKSLLETNKTPNTKLLFRGNGNRLADAFKQLIDAHLIIMCNKVELQEWISRHFQFHYRNETKDFKVRYLKDIISTDIDKCANPLINVTLDKATGRHMVQQA